MTDQGSPRLGGGIETQWSPRQCVEIEIGEKPHRSAEGEGKRLKVSKARCVCVCGGEVQAFPWAIDFARYTGKYN